MGVCLSRPQLDGHIQQHKRGRAPLHTPKHDSRKGAVDGCPPLDDDSSSDCDTLRESKAGSSSSEATTDAFTEAWLLATEYQREAGALIGADILAQEHAEPDGSTAANCACSRACGGGPCLACQPTPAILEGDMMGRPYDPYTRGPPRLTCPDARSRAAASLGPAIDGPPDPNVAHIIDLICQVFHVEAALLALFDDQRRIFIRTGRGFGRGDFPWRWSFCAWSMLPPKPEMMLVEDVSQDARFRDNEMARKLNVQFYCGAPLVGTNGQRLGTLSFVDHKPRKFPAEQLTIFGNMAELVVRELEREAADWAHQQEAAVFMSRALDVFHSGVAFVDTSQAGWSALHLSTAFTKMTGISVDQGRQAPLWELLQAPGTADAPEAQAAWTAYINESVALRTEFCLLGVTVAGAPHLGTFSLRFRPAGRDALDEEAIPIGIPAYVPSSPESSDHYYFAILAPCGGGGAGAGAAGVSDAELWQKDGTLSSGGGFETANNSSSSSLLQSGASRHSTAASGTGSDSLSSLMPDSAPFEGLSLGPLVGRGSYGSVYRGTWKGETVAVKICTPPLGPRKSKPALSPSDAWRSVEALESGKWRHPHIVAAYRHTTLTAQPPPTSGSLPEGTALPLPGADASQATAVAAAGAAAGAAHSGGSAAAAPGHGSGKAASPASGAPAAALQAGFVSPFAAAARAPTPLPGPLSAEARAAPPALQAAGSAAPAAMPPGRRGTSRAGSADAVGGGRTGKNAHGDVETWLLLEYCDAGTLQGGIDRGFFRQTRTIKDGKPDLRVILSVAADIVSALAYLHGAGVVHGDLAGGNVLLKTCEDRPHGFCAKVADFGMAKMVDIRQRISTESYGTVTHMPPELLSGGELSAAADVYSFGVLLWEMFCGTRAWAGLNVPQVLTAVAVRGRRLQFPEDALADFTAIANACMAGSPDARPTAAELEASISRVREGLLDGASQ